MLAEIIRSNRTLAQACRALSVGGPTLKKHIMRLPETDPARVEYEKRSYSCESHARRRERLGADDERRLEFCVSMSPAERDHILNSDLPIRYNGKRSKAPPIE